MTQSTADRAAVRAVLVKARERLSSPERWCQGAYAMSAAGRRTYVTSARAYRFCLLGAIAKESDSSIERDAAIMLLRELAGGPPDLWNDRGGRTHAEVLALLDAAIAAAGEEGR